MNYDEEQAMEVEALMSIYPEEYQEIEQSPRQFELRINATPSTEPDMIITIVFNCTFTPKYPEELPNFELTVEEGLEEEDVEQLKAVVQEQALANIGTPMIFTIASAAKEWVESTLEARHTAEREAAEKEAQRLHEEAIRAQGTPVTRENFLLWKLHFDRELDEQRQANNALKASDERKKKPTGRQLFEQDKSLGTSDVAILDENDVVIDESLFDTTDEPAEEEDEERPSFEMEDDD
ncbi:hypothetical protein CAOG_04442 [Capsaspora owczarzaki ATCC 30864]|uniref:RWD domain-containing protein n=1 Tax=Capsaspora owczarzaki (strain ATCC 30864) TaxID=595528 RepID=A0A0D2WRA1_CAPO3|nr:hypothetical protein CAOG_04442 [Capsaspora owczarzaki ATCC 30864]KJE93688.1 hypothetical protein CAOG_004442 [Capsaspora owczarzaki ATCC 30864]|eukprot:XP_004348270.2 hypothetical protein CAOG_04442 [Capsaspora owczarzaki ATCC 30864]